jgi:hypothetical protein
VQHSGAVEGLQPLRSAIAQPHPSHATTDSPHRNGHECRDKAEGCPIAWPECDKPKRNWCETRSDARPGSTRSVPRRTSSRARLNSSAAHRLLRACQLSTYASTRRCRGASIPHGERTPPAPCGQRGPALLTARGMASRPEATPRNLCRDARRHGEPALPSRLRSPANPHRIERQGAATTQARRLPWRGSETPDEQR